MGGVAKTVKTAVKNPLRAATAIGTGGSSEILRNNNPTARAVLEAPENAIYNLTGYKNPNVHTDEPSTDFGDKLTPEQLAAGQDIISRDSASRAASRDRLTKYLTKRNQDLLAQENPQIAEQLNRSGQYNSSAYPEAIARAQRELERQTQDTITQQTLADENAATEANSDLLARSYGLDDFSRQANLAKQYAAASQPKTNGKAGTGQVLQGVGAIAPLISLFAGNPAGALAGAAAPAAGDAVANVGGRMVRYSNTIQGASR